MGSIKTRKAAYSLRARVQTGPMYAYSVRKRTGLTKHIIPIVIRTDWDILRCFGQHSNQKLLECKSDAIPQEII